MSDDLLEYRIRYPGDGGGRWETPEPGATALSGAPAIEFRRIPLPSAAALRAYLAAEGWTARQPGPSGTMWAKGASEVGVVHDDEEFALRGAVERIARAEGRSEAEVMRAVNALQEAPNSHAGAPAADAASGACSCGHDRAEDRAGVSASPLPPAIIDAALTAAQNQRGLGLTHIHKAMTAAAVIAAAPLVAAVEREAWRDRVRRLGRDLHGRKWAYEHTQPEAFDVLHAAGNEVLALLKEPS